jgi:hypothetical protein
MQAIVGARAIGKRGIPYSGMTDQDLTTPFDPITGAPRTAGVNDAQGASEAVIREALSVIDQALGQIMSRELMSSGEVADVLLDVRTLLTAKPVEPV